MANTTSAKKATRKIARRTEVNKSRRSRVRGFIRKVEEAIASGDQVLAQAALKAAQPELMRAATKGVLHANTVARKLSRLSARIKALSAWAEAGMIRPNVSHRSSLEDVAPAMRLLMERRAIGRVALMM